ncbi:hypothetical protein GCM10011491_41880 [Brucella endophytica]|uniref:Uncharacterized protein n=1 Tax=Brucella endophytica TaxID=1963359 RepID=A0A916SP54_9HYPH|nr:hypothetical protein [Brucella endophytica]GGB09528.1 hypothetical protein GCM10011491_41880 [Brucella endophytica]
METSAPSGKHGCNGVNYDHVLNWYFKQADGLQRAGVEIRFFHGQIVRQADLAEANAEPEEKYRNAALDAILACEFVRAVQAERRGDKLPTLEKVEGWL